jgi:hypothetical protein
MDTSLPPADCTSSTLTEIGQRSDALIKIGEKLVAELNLENTDTLGRWMAHYIAERIAEVENASGNEKEQTRAACAEEILQIWSRRRHYPRGSRPFEDFEPVLRTLRSLDLSSQVSRYFDWDIANKSSEEEGSRSGEWLEIANRIDLAAKILIRGCLAAAVAKAVDRSRPWIALAESAASENDSDIPTFKFLIENADLISGKGGKEHERKQLEKALEMLEGFESSVRALREGLKKRLGDATESDAPS